MFPKIVLVRPRNPNNIGAVARAMNNFGFSELVVVAPHPPVWDEALASAVGAEEVIRNARVATSLQEAVSDCTMVIGTIDQRRAVGRTPQQILEEGAWKGRRCAIVFGTEKSGLSREDLSYCSTLLNIPTSPACPSMNLAQAAAVVFYEFTRTGPSSAPAIETREAGVTAAEVLLLLTRLAEVLKMTGFTNETSEGRMLMEIRSSIMRAGLTRRELSLWLGALRRITHSIEQ